MMSAKSETVFKYIGRGYQKPIVLIPGWANDYRIFGALDLKFNYLIPVNSSPFTFEKGLLAALKENNISRISLFGHSMGGFIASEFASKYPNLIDEIILTGIRKRYPLKGLADVRKNIKNSKKGFLYKVYSQCFPNREDMRWFKENLLKAYCEELDLDNLLKDLDYLENAEIKPEQLIAIKKITIIHGEKDQIAPIQEAIDISERLPHAKFVCVPASGHIPVLRKDFTEFL